MYRFNGFKSWAQRNVLTESQISYLARTKTNETKAQLQLDYGAIKVIHILALSLSLPRPFLSHRRILQQSIAFATTRRRLQLPLICSSIMCRN
jgi:hypothetical protein